MTFTCPNCRRDFKRDKQSVYCSRSCQAEGARKRSDGQLTPKLGCAILSCFTRDELLVLRSELDRLIAQPNYTPKPFTL